MRHHLCPSLCVSLHLLCISLLPCRKKHNSFVVYSSQSGSELGVVSCFLCSPDRTDSGPVAPFGLVCSSRKLRTVITWWSVTIISPLSPLQICGRFSALSHQPTAESHAKGQNFDENNVMQGLHRHYREQSLVGIGLTASMTAARKQGSVNSTVVTVRHYRGTRTEETQESMLGSDDNISVLRQ